MAIIQLGHLSKRYGNQTVLDDINLVFEKGQIVGYIGPNGAGKSTTIKIMAGLLDEFEGEVRILDRDIRAGAPEIKRHIGYIPEQAVLYDVLTPNEYFSFLGSLYEMEEDTVERRATELLRLFGLAGQADTRLAQFSKGMRQKVLLIGGLIHNPEIIFLDEPLSGLDANAVILVKEILSQLRRDGKTIIYSSHLMDIVEKISDRIVIINHGKVVADGTFEELRARSLDSLEHIFTSLTGNTGVEATASEFLDVLKQS